MNALHAVGTALAGLALIALIACGEDSSTTDPPDGPVAGTLALVLTTPNSGLDGAAVVILSGPSAPTDPTPATGLELWGAPLTAVDTFALTGVLNAGTILSFDVADVSRVGEYSAQLREVAAADQSVALRDLAGYALVVVTD